MSDIGSDLLVLAELNPDVVVRCEHDDIRFGQTEQLVGNATLTLGSSGAITASAAAAQRVRVALCAVVGDDEAGRLSLEMLAGQGVATAAVVQRTGRSTGMTVVLSAASGDRALLTFPGTMGELRVGDVPLALLERARHLHVSSIFLQTGLHDGLAALLGHARARGTGTSLDPGWDPAQQWDAVLPLLPELDYLLPNRSEVLAIAGAAGSATTDPVDAAQLLAALGPTVVVKDGERGAIVADHRGVSRITAPRTEVSDSTGAGDNFDGGFLAAVLDGADAVTAARRGVASGSLSVRGWGGTGRHATRAEALRVGQELPVIGTPITVATKESR